MDLTHWQPFINWLHTHPHWIGLITCLIAMTESLVVIGLIVPGAVMMVGIGTLVGAQVIPFTSTMLYGVLGAVLGDGISYWCGHHYHEHLRELWPFKKYPHWLHKGEAFFATHGTKSVFLGRFVGPVRPLVPVIAGMLNMPALRFYTANIISACIWSPSYMLPGIIIGQASREFGPQVASRFLLTVFAALIVLAISAWLIKYLYQRSTQLIHILLQRAWSWLQNHYSSSYLYRYCSHAHLTTPYTLFGLIILMLILLVAFTLTAISALNQGVITQWNEPVFYLLRSLRNPKWDQVMVAITLLGNSKTIIPLWGILSCAFVIKKQWRILRDWLLIGILAGSSILGIKYSFFSARPGQIMHVAVTSSFPSAHTSLACLCYGLLAVWFNLQCRSNYVRHAITVSALTLITAVAFSRMYLGAHWLSDIIAAFLLASFFITLGTLLYLRAGKQRLSIALLSTHLALGLCLILPVQFHTKFQHYIYNHTPAWPSHTMTVNTWWQDPQQPFALYLYSRTAKPIAPFNVQWLGELAHIKSHLVQQGWETPKKPALKDRILQLKAASTIHSQPFFSKLYQNQKPSLSLIKYYGHADNALILQLWQANITLSDNALPLWIGTLYELTPKTLFKHHYPISNILDQPQSPFINYITKDLKPWRWKTITRPLTANIIKKLHLQQQETHILLICAPASS